MFNLLIYIPFPKHLSWNVENYMKLQYKDKAQKETTFWMFWL